MILNFYIIVLLLFIYVCLLFCMFLFDFKLNEFSPCASFLNKLILDEFYFMNFYFTWSNFFFLFLLLPILFVPIITNRSFSLFSTRHIYIIFTLITASLYYFDYCYFNSVCLFDCTHLSNHNGLLFNSVNKIHPFLLYISLISLFLFVFNNYRYLTYEHKNIFFLKKVYNFLSYFSVSAFSIFLGGWWALQEGSWGGWWDWDISEVFGMFIVLRFIIVLHSKINYLNTELSFLKIVNSLHVIFIYYIFMQLNFNLISHNFNLHSFSNTYTILVYSTSLVLSIIFFFSKTFFLKSSITSLFSFKFWNFKSTSFRLFYLFFLFISSCTVFFSTLPILSVWLWQNFSLSLFVTSVNFNYLTGVFLFFIVFLNWSPINYLSMILLLFCTLCSPYSIIYVCVFHLLIFKFFQPAHNFFFLFLLLNFVCQHTEILFWDFSCYGYNRWIYYTYNILKLDEPFLTSSKSLIYSSLSKHKNFDYWYDYSILDLKIFELDFSVFGVRQSFFHDSVLGIFFTSVESCVEPTLLFFILWILYVFYNKTYRIIVF